MAKEGQKLTFDKRTSVRYVEKGVLSRTDYDNYLKNLPDEGPNADWVQMDMDEPEMSGEVQDDEGSNGSAE